VNGRVGSVVIFAYFSRSLFSTTHMAAILERDSALRSPSFTIVSASAGSGKTYTLTLRYVQLLLSPLVSQNGLKNILAITFTNNAASEMRQRVLTMLKKVALGDREATQAVGSIVSLSEPELRARARRTVDDILDNFSDFQVRTIDSFLGQVFRASALEFGFNPEFEVVMSNRELVDYAFELYAKQIRPGSAVSGEFMKMAEIITSVMDKDRGYVWDPYAKITQEVKRLQSLIASQQAELHTGGHSAGTEEELRNARKIAADIRGIVARYDAKMDSHLHEELKLLDSDDWSTVFTRSLKSKVVNKGGTKAEKERAAACERDLGDLLHRYNASIASLDEAHAREYFRPYASVLAMIAETLESVKRSRGRLFIGDINKAIVRSLSAEVVPEIYFTLGERIAHYLIDEFQDTSPIQWAALSVLAGNALSEGGTLLIVGDTKQSIYGFRGADWQIMMNLMTGEEGFPSAAPVVHPLKENRRSGEKVVLYTRDLFQQFNDENIAVAAQRSGLLGFDQQALPENRGRGVVEAMRFMRDPGSPAERKKILELIASARRRGYDFRDIAILTPRNANVIEVSGWLNDAGIPFISHSSLDVRIQRVTTEIIALLQFLDSPVDDLAFASFLLGETFPQSCARSGQSITHDEIVRFILRSRSSRHTPLYKAFQQEYPGLWNGLFESLFTIVGYAPLYDLVVEAYKVLDLFDAHPEEGQALVKLLEVIKEFEENGRNSIKDFLEFTGEEDEEGDWDVDSGSATDAVRLMTVHKSKGLEFPLVIVLLSEYRPRGFSPILYTHGDEIELLHVTSSTAKRSPLLDRVYSDQRIKGLTDMLNSLYVALTRAKDELYVLAVSSGEEARVPCSLVSAQPAAEESLPPARKETPEASEELLQPSPHAVRRHSVPVREEKLGFEETRRGDALHAVLAQLEFVEGDVGECLDDALLRVGVPDGDREGAKMVLHDFLSESGILEHFRPLAGRRVMNEQELTNGTGDLFRADRLVIDEDHVTVIDYKTGREHNEEQYRQQLRNYMRLVSEVLGVQNVRGCIAYVDLKKLLYIDAGSQEGGRTP
jgi:ATP-dependent helicase/nuclease subunit A